MKHIRLFTVIATCLLVTSVFTVIPAFSAQPPIDTSTYYVGTIGQPARLDPGRAYDTASGEIIQNVYQPLIWFSSKNVLPNPSGIGYPMTQADHADLSYPSGYAPIIAAALPTISPSGIGSGQLWNFTINTNAQFQTWTGPDGVINGQPKRNVTTDDVVYSFQVQMVMDSPSAPVWMLETAAFNIGSFGVLYPYANGGGGTGTVGAGYNPADEAVVAAMIQQWCYKDHDHPTTNVIFNWSYPLPLSAMAQIMSQTWGSIVNMDFYIDHGNWNYNWYTGWSADYRWQPDGSGNRTPIDRYYSAKSLYTSATPIVGTDIPDMCGTGPYQYKFGGWNQITSTWRLDYDPTYWKDPTFANAGDGAGNYIHTIIERGISNWPTREMLFLDGEFDTAVVPTANMFSLLVGNNTHLPLQGLTLVTGITRLQNEEVFFTFNVSGASSYQSYDGINNNTAEPYFFNNTAMRLAFAYALNYTQVIQQGWFGEAVQQASWWVDGLVPASSKNLTLTANMRNIDLAKMQYYLSQAIIGGQNIAQVGFRTTAIYNTGNVQRQFELQSIANAFAQAGPNYIVNVVGLDWPVYVNAMNTMQMPMFCGGWLADYADPSDWAAPYQQSTGSASYFLGLQGPPFPADQAAVDAEIAAAAIETNAALRDQLYQDLQYKFWLDVPSIPVVQPVGIRFARDWVYGWYYNDLLPGLYAYDLYKSGAAPTTPIDLDVQDTIAPLTTYSKVLISMGQMTVIFGGGVLAQMTFNVTVKRNDAAGLVPAIVSLVRDNLTALTDYRLRQSSTSYDMTGVPWPNGGWVYIEGGTGGLGTNYRLLGAQSPVYPSQVIIGTTGGTSTSVTLTWYEDGVTSTLPANATWSMGALVGIPSTAGGSYYLSNLTDNQVTLDPNTYNYTAKTETTQLLSSSPSTYDTYFLLVGDINGDGVVNILDAILLSNFFLTTPPSSLSNGKTLNWSGLAAPLTILSAIILANNFNKKMGFLSDP
jgi:peptide/nickel transport system substrate-binding protein